MPNSFDRLERLFSKRKDLTIQTTPASFEYTGPKTASLDHSFPQPSFIRPRVSRMKARDERIVASQNERRTQSLPENQSERVSIHISHLSSSSATTLNLPARSMSLNQRRETQTVASLRGFDFPAPPTGRLPASPACATSSPRTLPAMHKVSPEHRHSSVILPPRADTPPSSDHEDDSSIKSSQVGRPSSAMSSDLPTPAASPEMKPVHEKRSSRDSAELSLAKRKAVAAATRRRREDKATSLRRPRESRSHRSATSSSQILKGGDVRDFFALSDDDILEEPELEEVPDTPIIPAPSGRLRRLQPRLRHLLLPARGGPHRFMPTTSPRKELFKWLRSPPSTISTLSTLSTCGLSTHPIFRHRRTGRRWTCPRHGHPA
ncbi:hypothetical protein CGLO_11603 [Colletotrichum gloeosporioides Cg-14]|uniref:Uncharacterized protein n=1 Tax=Colletotrichum gloeosporioides (strain Cg-14) TaxID=1237896 RepID=T0KAM9_COLGC|nr:hypothetical protein CGLO_11603 [Colletotrichum gloeosporioides Cg-14]